MQRRLAAAVTAAIAAAVDDTTAASRATGSNDTCSTATPDYVYYLITELNTGCG